MNWCAWAVLAVSDGVELPAVSAPLPWQAAEWRTVTTASKQEKLAHALLLSGQPGIGCTRFAEALARFLLCLAPQGDMNCGECKACVLSARGTHSDFCRLAPEGKSQTIGITQVRELIEFSARTSSQGPRKVVLLAPADRLNINAANALLKCLEEPGRDTFMLLVADSPQSLPATVRSRCQQLRFPLPPRQSVLAWLRSLAVSDAQASDAQASDALRLARSLPLVAEHLVSSGDLEAVQQRESVLADLLDGRAREEDAVGALSHLDLGPALHELELTLMGRLRTLDAQHLRSASGRSMLDFLAELCQLQRAMAKGANPQRDLLLLSLTSRLRGAFGNTRSDARL